jgi:hypothetical protein
MTAPVRIQRKRTKGWKMPDNTVYVGRPTIWGNPYKTDRVASDVQRYRKAMCEPLTLARHQILSITPGNQGRGIGRFAEARVRLDELRGKNLACWCSLDQPCHADVLLKLANAKGET